VWRRVGARPTFVFLFVVCVACGYALWRARGPLLAVDYGANPWLWPPALAFYGGAIWIQKHVKRHLTFRIMAGVPELAEDRTGGRLLQGGVYARVRHPRYLAVTLSMIGWALFTNFLATYVLVPVTAGGLAAIAWFEERELRDRFGAEHDAYRRKVPMIIPRLSGLRGQ